MGRILKPFPYTRVQNQGPLYLKHKFDALRRALKKQAEQAKVTPIRKQVTK